MVEINVYKAFAGSTLKGTTEKIFLIKNLDAREFKHDRWVNRLLSTGTQRIRPEISFNQTSPLIFNVFLLTTAFFGPLVKRTELRETRAISLTPLLSTLLNSLREIIPQLSIFVN